MLKKTRGVIAAGHQKTVEAGQIMFALGGNAFDAAIASALATFVVESTLSHAGGGGFLLAHTQDKKNILFDFFCQTPYHKKPLKAIDFSPVDVNYGGEIQTFHIGLGSIATPGALAGMFAVHQELGKLPFQVVAEPAIEYAKNGFVLSRYNSFCQKLLEPILLAYPESRKIYAPQGRLLVGGEVGYMKDFADTLTELARQGFQFFYQGDIAHQICNDLSEGGHLTLEDLINYRVITRKPLITTYRGYELVTNPPPSSGGILIAFALKLLEKIDLNKVAHNSAQYLQILAEIMSLTNRARADGYDAHFHRESIEEQFLSEDSIALYQPSLNKLGSTTHISVMDEEGNAASVTMTNGEGSSYIIPGTGIMLNNMLGEADLNPLGFHQWQCNQRISSMMSPTMILKDGKPQFVLGSGGSNRIRTAILQVIVNLLDFHQPLEEAVKHSRIHWENNILSVEPFPERESIIQDLQLPESTLLTLWPEQNMFFGGVHTVGVTEAGMVGAGDPRRDGVANSYQ